MHIDPTAIKKINSVSKLKYFGLDDIESAGANTDSLSVSRRALEVARGVQAAKAAPEVREVKVAEAAEKIASGKLELSSKALAEKLLSRLRKEEV